MKSTIVATGLLLACTAVLAPPAVGQYGGGYGSPPPPRQPQQQIQAPAQQTAATGVERQVTISKAAMKAVEELQNAVKANDVATIPAKLAAAQAVATTPDDRHFIAVLQLRAALAAGDNASIASGIEAMIASGGAQPSELPILHRDLGTTYGKLKQYSRAAAAYEQYLKLAPADAETTVSLAETRNHEGKVSEAVALLQKAIRIKQEAGEKVDERWYKRALSLAYKAELPVAVELGRQWAQAYPSAAAWRDALRIYRNLGKPSGDAMLDTLRLARVTGALDGDADYNIYAYTASDLRNAREAKLLLDEAAAAKKIDPNKPLFKEIDAALKSKPMPGEDILTASAEKALAGSDVAALTLTADRFYGIGNYARAAELFRAALGKPGADQSLLNLRLGIALARSGDKAGATAAFNTVTGARGEIAKFWLAYLSTQA